MFFCCFFFSLSFIGCAAFNVDITVHCVINDDNNDDDDDNNNLRTRICSPIVLRHQHILFYSIIVKTFFLFLLKLPFSLHELQSSNTLRQIQMEGRNCFIYSGENYKLRHTRE